MLLSLLLLASSSFAAPQWNESFSAALAQAKSSGKPVLMDFQAPWCYSCYYMEKHVLDTEAFEKAAQGFVLLKVDVDKEEGHALKEKMRVSFLPSYVVLSPKEEQVGRIVGEQTAADFIRQLDALRGPSAADPMDAAVSSLRKSLAANDYDKAVQDVARLSSGQLKTLQARKDWQLLYARLELMRAVRAKWPAGVESLKKTLALDDSCEVAYDVDYAEGLVDQQKPEARKTILEEERAVLEKLADARLLVPAASRCADMRSGLEMLGDVYGKLGETDKQQALYKRTVDFLASQGVPPGEDRNFDDNMRFFLELQGDEAALSKEYAALIEAYPTDFVYNQRWASWLQAHGKSEAALPFIEKADKLAYGANRYRVTSVRAKVLADLGRGDEALALLKRDSKAMKKAFPKEAESLEKLSDEIAAKAKQSKPKK